MVGLCCCAQAFSSCSEQGLFFVTLSRFLIAVASHVVSTEASTVAACRLWSAGSVVVVHGLSCPAACGIFPDQGWNPHCKMDA